MRIIKFYVILLVYIFFLLSGCRNDQAPCILISKSDNTVFSDWLTRVNVNLDFINMYQVGPDSIEYFLGKSSGIIISGGPDVNPALYGKEDEIWKCEDIDFRRDTLELRMIRYAMENKIPLLGICRGIQILNVAYGGTLISNIQSDFNTNIQHSGNTDNHWVNLTVNSLLYTICRTKGDSVNSSHHQAVRDVASLFRAVAFAEDGLIEAIEPADTSDHHFILGVQWHPERMDFTNPLCGRIAEKFIEEVYKTYRLSDSHLPLTQKLAD